MDGPNGEKIMKTTGFTIMLRDRHSSACAQNVFEEVNQIVIQIS